MYPAWKGGKEISDGPGYLACPAREIGVARLLSARMMVEAKGMVKRVLLRRSGQENSSHSGA